MLIYFILALITHLIILGITTFFISFFSVMSFILLIYLLPIVITITLTIWMLKNKRVNPNYAYSFSLVSLLMYIALGFILTNSPRWISFIQQNTLTTEEFYIEINANLLSASQLIFVSLLYFLSVFITIQLLKRRRMTHDNYHSRRS